MRAIWIDKDAGVEEPRLSAAGLQRLYFAYNEGRLTKQFLQDFRDRGWQVGLYRGHGWDDDVSAREQAERLNARWEQLYNGNPLWVMVDEEEHNAQKLLELFGRWRELRPTLATSWTMEPMQGGWWDTSVTPPVFKRDWLEGCRQQLLDWNIRFVPQCYGSVVELYDPAVVVHNLELGGVPRDMITPFYDAQLLPMKEYDGCAFLQSRLP